MRCGFCGFYVHTHCDDTLTVKSTKMVNDERHPSICYQCSSCRAVHSGLTVPMKTEQSVDTESRLCLLEQGLKKLTSMVQGLNEEKHSSITEISPPQIAEPHTECVAEIVAAKVHRTKVSRSNITLRNPKHELLEKTNRTVVLSKASLSVICTNVPEATETLLANRYEHDQNQWLQLCSRMCLRAITPISLIRLSRKRDSPNFDKPRLLKVVVQNEKDLEDILLSSYLIREDKTTNSRIFADVPWSERKTSSLTEAGHHKDKGDGRSLLILNVPESVSSHDANCSAKHDYQQWKYFSDTVLATDPAVIDIFRIPKSTKYEGSGPRPLKLTLLTSGMAETVYDNWKRFRAKLPKEIRIIHRVSKPETDTAKVPAPGLSQTSKRNSAKVLPKNDQQPAPTESAI